MVTNNRVNLEQVCSLNIEQSRLLQYRAICPWKMEWQSIAIVRLVPTPPPQASLHPPQDPQEAQDESTADKKGLSFSL